MDENFRALVLRLVEKCGNNQRAACRLSNLPGTVINAAVRGVGPKYPRPETWAKLRAAVGDPPGMVRESSAGYGDKFSKLAEWLRKNPDRFPIFEQMAKELGYKKEGE